MRIPKGILNCFSRVLFNSVKTQGFLTIVPKNKSELASKTDFSIAMKDWMQSI